MKLDPLFTVKENKLYSIENNSQVDIATLSFEKIAWSTVELEDEAYNEEFLAALREKLKNYELLKTFAVLEPVVDKPLETPEQIELFINAFNHTARRVKDCINVVGFVLPAELSTPEQFIETLSIKHAQYVYFSKAENVPSNIVKF